MATFIVYYKPLGMRSNMSRPVAEAWISAPDVTRAEVLGKEWCEQEGHQYIRTANPVVATWPDRLKQAMPGEVNKA